jgi:hypothetical protein
MTRDEIIADLREKNPVMKSGNDIDGYVEFTTEEYEAQINAWADYLIEEAETKAKAASDKAALLARLGITAEEAQLLLGGN